MTEQNPNGDPIAEVFPVEDVEARFVVAMSIARNDIALALHDAIAAADQDRQDFTYRVRLATSHLVEALDSVMAYTQAFPELKQLMNRVPARHQKELATARGIVQNVGDMVLGQIRNNTFHYPSPKSRYNPTSDEQLRDVLAGMRDRACTMHLDHRGSDPVITLTFADDVALALALAKHSADDTTARRQFELTGVGAAALGNWAEALLGAYLDGSGGYLGSPEPIGPGESA